MKLVKRAACLIVAVCMLLSSQVVAEAPYETYTYDYYGNSVASPDAYTPGRIIDGEILGAGHLKGPKDIFIQNDLIYIADTGNNRVVIADLDWQLVSVIDSFDNEGTLDTFNGPHGLFVTENDDLYIADTTNQRIVHLDPQGQLVRTIGAPESEILDENFLYMPTALSLDSAGRFYIIGMSVNQGIIELNADGDFTGFIGASKVTPSVSDIFWKQFSTEEQRKRMISFVPTEYNNISIDNKGFLYTVTSTIDATVLTQKISGRSTTDVGAPIKKLNLQGSDVMQRKGSFLPAGDIEYPGAQVTGYKYLGPSKLVDVCVEDFGGYTVLDSNRGHIFTYDHDGNLMYAFGAPGEIEGTFRQPVAIEVVDDRLFVVDTGANNITEFHVTEYGNMVKEALIAHDQGRYDEATTLWELVLKKNANSELAHTGIGKAYLRKESYKNALDHFKLGNNKVYYSKAFKYYRREVLSDYFNLIMGGILLLGLLIFIRKRYKARKGQA